MTMKSKLFMSGRSQAIRLPAAARMPGSDVRIEKVGIGLWITPEPSPQQDMAAWLRDFYATAGDTLPDAFLADRDDVPPQERDWDGAA